jgi:hypothetical protein
MDGARAIAEGLANNSKLQRLDLSWNGLEDDGASALGRCLHKNDTLQVRAYARVRVRVCDWECACG